MILPSLSAAQVILLGQVTDENNAPVAGVRITVRAESVEESDAAQFSAVSDPTGAFTLPLPEPGHYRIEAEREGYFPLRDSSRRLQEGTNPITLVLNPVRELFESVEVTGTPPIIDFSQTASQANLHNAQIVLQPYPNTHDVRNALRLLPGVVQDASGRIHIHGAGEEQAQYLLDGFTISDPLTGRFESRLSAEAVRSLDLSSGRFSAEFGKGSAGALALRTGTGDDKFRYSATNFVPGIAHRKGWTVNAWTPRFNVSGPLRKGRAWFSDSLAAQYDQTVVDELPEGQDRSPSWQVSNLLRHQINLRPSNILTATFLLNYGTAQKDGLSPLDPAETTVDRRSHQYFVSLKDQLYFSRGVLLEVGYAANRTFHRDRPQGNGPYQLTPSGRRGNFFADAERRARRDQWLTNLFLPEWGWSGRHQVKAGLDVNRLSYWQNIRRTGYENYGAEGRLLSRVEFGGDGLARRANLEASFYLQDTWRVTPRLVLEAGLRHDWDELLGNHVFSPRLAWAWGPPPWERTKISGGYAVVYDATNLRVFTRPLDQYSLTTTLRADGSIERGPAVTAFTLAPGPLRTPRYQNWSLSVEQGLRANLSMRLNYLRKRGRDGLTYLNSMASDNPLPPQELSAFNAGLVDVLFRLENFRRDVYDSYEFTARQTFRGQYEWLASYTRSRALSNAVVDVASDEPLVISENTGPMPWDSPNRFLSWGSLPTFRKNWTWAYLVEWRDGFPFSIQDDAGRVVGALNSRRFPAYFELNLHFERRFRFRGYWWAFRFGFNNITNHKNPNVVNTIVSSPEFLSFYGGQPRAFTFRIRWLGET